MTQDQIVAALGSAPFVVAFVSLVRKFFPQLDGKAVLLVVLGVSVVIALLIAFASQIPEKVWPAIFALYTAIMAAGGNEWATGKTKLIASSVGEQRASTPPSDTTAGASKDGAS